MKKTLGKKVCRKLKNGVARPACQCSSLCNVLGTLSSGQMVGLML